MVVTLANWAWTAGMVKDRLNQAEIEISMFSRGCLGNDRIATSVTLAKRAAAWTKRMNEEQRKIDWRFTRAKARKKFG